MLAKLALIFLMPLPGAAQDYDQRVTVKVVTRKVANEKQMKLTPTPTETQLAKVPRATATPCVKCTPTATPSPSVTPSITPTMGKP